MKKLNLIMLIFSLSFITACATIPQESIHLSRQVGVGLRKQHQSQIDLVNIHFAIKREALYQAMNKALNKYFKTLTSAGKVTLNRTQLSHVAADIMELIEKNNLVKEELEKARLLIIKRLNENYLALNEANSSITGLLQSAFSVEESNSEALKSISKATGGKIDLDKAFNKVDEFILKGGKQAGKSIKLVDKLNELLD